MLSNDFHYLGLIVLFPLIGAMINGLFGAKLSKGIVGLIATGAMLASFFTAILSVSMFHASGLEYLTYTAYQWIHTGGLHLDLAFMIDPLSSVMILIITGVGFLIHLYSTSYMDDDPGKWKYFTYLNLFVFAMLLLVLGQNMLVTFIGWEGVGACSYLLIGFWYSDDEKAAAGQKAFIVNRVGDFAFILGILLLYVELGTFDYIEINAALGTAEGIAKLAPIALPAVLLIFFGCTGKSAQIPLYTWLPDAMAGPTPVSALIHAATMVTSGIFLLSRLNGLVTMAWQAMAVIALVGALTAFFAATIAFVQTDIKKVLAYSTVSQLGYMFMGIGVGSFVGAVFHLMTHAFFKALLFLGSGSVIHAMGGEQDIRKMGGLKAYMPVTRMTFLIGCVAIAGVPFVASGFFSKDLILWSAVSNVHIGQVVGLFDGLPTVGALLGEPNPVLAQGNPLEVMMIWKAIYGLVAVLGFATAGMTAFYMFRLYFLTFEGECRADDHTKAHLHESPTAITLPLSVLAILSVIGGWTGWPHFIAHWKPLHAAEHYMLAFEHWLQPVFEISSHRVVNHFGAHYGMWEALSAVAGSSLALGGIFAAHFIYMKRPSIARNFTEKYRTLHKVLNDKYRVDEAYDFLFVRATIGAGKASYEADKNIIDGVMVNGTGFVARSLGMILRHLQGGDVQKYAVYLVVSLTLAFMLLTLV